MAFLHLGSDLEVAVASQIGVLGNNGGSGTGPAKEMAGGMQWLPKSEGDDYYKYNC